MNELDTVVLNKDIKKHGLKKGDVGTVVHIYKDNKAVEVEFITAEGKTVAVVTLKNTEIRSIARNEILHVRGFASI
jgi:ribosomal protein L24